VSNEVKKMFFTELKRSKIDFSETAVIDETELLITQNAHLAIDPAAENLMTYTAFILACYRALVAAGIESRRSRDILGKIMEQSWKSRIQTHVSNRFGLLPAQRKGAFETVAANFKTVGEKMYGAAFRYEQELQDSAHSFVNIHTCFFNDFLNENGAPELNRLFCNLDNLWAEELEHHHGVYFRRPETLEGGGAMCRFQFFCNQPAASPEPQIGKSSARELSQ
jgi:hypothetical protein